MSEIFFVLIIVAVVLSFLTTGIYYLWISIIAFFPKKQWHKDIPYDQKIDMNFFVVIPCLNEEKVIVESVKNLIDIGMKQTHIVVVDDDSDDETVNLLYQNFENQILTVQNDGEFHCNFKGKPIILLQKRKPQARLGKGNSLNCAYQLINSYIETQGLDKNKCVMSVFDADTFMTRSVFERVAVIMNEEPLVGMVQTRVRIGTTTRNHFLPLLQDIEFFTYINNMQNVREYTGTVSAAGNGQFNRFSAIDPKEPWTDCLLEDFDFSLRLLLKGWRTRLLQDHKVFQQGVWNYWAFLKQRSRWCQGGIQCIKYWNDIVHSRFLSSYGKMELIYFMLLPFVTILSVITQILSWIVILWFFFFGKSIIKELFVAYPTWELAVVLLIVLGIVFLPGLVYCASYWKDSKESFITCLLAGLFQPIYNIMMVPAVLMAVFRQLIGKKSWIKTTHYEDDMPGSDKEKIKETEAETQLEETDPKAQLEATEAEAETQLEKTEDKIQPVNENNNPKERTESQIKEIKKEHSSKKSNNQVKKSSKNKQKNKGKRHKKHH